MATLPTPAAPQNPGRDVGITFVGMMFAVAVGDVAAEMANIVSKINACPGPVGPALWEVLPSIAHSLLVLLVIATSWVGWSHSSATAEYMEELKTIFSNSKPYLFSFPFLMLSIDVLGVVFYFILSSAAEMPVCPETGCGLKLTPSAGPELFWILVILVSYLIWNLLYALHGWRTKTRSFLDKQRGWRMFSAVVSIAIAAIAFCAYWFRTTGETHQSVLLTDGALALTVLIFRNRIVDKNTNKWIASDIVRFSAMAVAALVLISFANWW